MKVVYVTEYWESVLWKWWVRCPHAWTLNLPDLAPLGLYLCGYVTHVEYCYQCGVLGEISARKCASKEHHG